MRKAASLGMLALVACGRVGFDQLASGGVNSGDDGGGVGDDGGGSGGDASVRTCASLANICGPSKTSSCCDSLVVTGGAFARSYDRASDGMFSDASYAATVSDFSLDKYEVTVARFRQFVQAGFGTQAKPPGSGAGAHPNIPNSGWNTNDMAELPADQTALVAALNCDSTYQTWTDTPAGNEGRPINCISWFDAMAFCAWDGGFLPTEAEWNYAAAGGSEQRAFPWSSPPDDLAIDAMHTSYYGGTDCVGDSIPGCGMTDQRIVGSTALGDGFWRQSDLGGNALEWVLDWYASPYPQNPCPDCANLTPATNRVIRGGGFTDGRNHLRTADRMFASPAYRHFVGVRCARAP